jgi:hypothetical protein
MRWVADGVLKYGKLRIPVVSGSALEFDDLLLSRQ